MRITKPELKVVRFASEDVIATSLFGVPNAGDDGYTVYTGTIYSLPQNDGLWGVAVSGEYGTMTSSEYDEFKNNIGRDTLYEAFDDNGYYTYGVEIKASIAGGAEDVSGAPTNPPPFPGFGQ